MLGLDPGERRIGVALSDTIGIIAQPHVVLDRRQVDAVAEIAQLCAEYEVETVVIGLPKSLSGEEGPSAAMARELGAAIGEATGCEITFFDERFTTVQAESALLEGGMRRRQRRETVDKVAAAMMLQGFLDSQS
ncbi:MAG: Holliday junction resolvase RuvX [Acidimicrobiia bacterium]|nr:Holliday junction resolvase RuvX [Acidimicrobiia bacterium]